MVLDHFEVRSVCGSDSERKLELLWVPLGSKPIWRSVDEIAYRMRRLNQHAASRIERYLEEQGGRRRAHRTLLVPNSKLSFAGLEGYTGVIAGGRVYFQSDIPVVDYINTVLSGTDFDDLARAFIYICSCLNIYAPV